MLPGIHSFAAYKQLELFWVYTLSDFTAAATPISGSQKQFTVGLNNCQTPLAGGDTAKLTVTGQTSARAK
jgi:type 1 fimbria pilin